MARNCFAPGCDSGYSAVIARNKALGKKNPSLFCAPKEAELLEKWQRAIPRKDKVFAPPLKLCELHFDEECILRTYEKMLADGSVFVYERGRPSLKPGSIPTKFPNLPKYLSSETPNRKAPTSQNKRKRESSEKMHELTHSQIMNDSKDLERMGELEVNSIEKPDGWNIYKNDNGHILCIKLDADCRFERHIVITQDYSVKIFLRNKEIKLADESKIQNTQNVSLLLKSVDDLVICNHLESWQLFQSCLGFASYCPSQNVNVCSICQDHNRTQTTSFKEECR